MSSQNFVIKKGLTVDTTEVIDLNAELTTAAFGTAAEEKIQDVVGGLLNAGTGITLDYNDAGNSLTISGNVGTITGVTAGNGLTGGGSTGDVTINIGAGTGINIGADDISVNLSAFTTDNLGEGTGNLYWTQSRFDTAFTAKDTDSLSEGSSNLYFTDERVDDRVAALLTEGSNITLTYDDALGTLTISAVEDYLANNTTDDLTEGSTNLYYTDERVDDRVASLLTAGSNITLTYDDVANTLTVATDADITGVTAGNGLSGGGTTGAVSLAVDYDDSSIGLDGLNKLAVKSSGVTNDMLAGSITNAKLVNSSITVNGTSVSLGGSVTLDTDDVAEGATNLYYTDERVQDTVGDQFVTNGTHTGISFAYDDANDGAIDATVSLSPFDTDDLSEGTTNLYYTDERVDDRVNALLVGGNVLTSTYDDINGTLTVDHDAVTRTNGTDSATLTHEGTFDAISAITTSTEGHVTGVTTKTFTMPAGAVPNDGTLTVAGGTDLEVNVAGDSTFTADQAGASTITLDHSAVTRSNTGATPSQLSHSGTFDAITGVTTSSTGHVTGVETSTFTLPAGAVPNDGILTIEGGTDLELGSLQDGTFSADQAGNETVTLNHSAVTRSDTTSSDSPAHGGTFEAVTSVTTSSTGHVTAVDVSTVTLPAGANNATITIAAGTNLTTGGDFTTDQASNETITINMDSDIDVTSVTADYIDVQTDVYGVTPPTHAEGRLWWSDEYNTLNLFNDISDVTLQIGHEEWVRVYNNTGSSISDGTPVYVTGATGETPTIAPADATTEVKSHVLGITTHTIANGASGIVTTRGLVSGIDTSALTAGSPVHISPSGGYQTASPSYPYFPTEIGTCVVSDATNGYIYVTMHQQTMESLRVAGNSHMDGNLTVEGNLTVNGTQTITNQANLAIADSFVYLNSGDTIGEANTNFTGTGLDDAYFTGYYEGTSSSVTYYVRIDGVGTGTGGVDTFEWSYDNFATTEATGVDITGAEQALADNIGIFFNATTGHTSGDKWDGTVSPVNIDTGWVTNRNTGATGVGYTHMGVYFDASDSKFKVFDEYDPEPSGEINTAHASFSLGTLVANTFEGALSGNATTASSASTATTLTGLTATIAELNILDGVTATAAELNVLDGITATTAELNILDGVTATAAELNVLDGITASTAELNILDGVTATATELNVLDGINATLTAAELNILDGVTATTAELNILDGVTATTAELNVLDGITATTTELNYTDGVTSNIQTQLNGKQATLSQGTGVTISSNTVSIGQAVATTSDVTFNTVSIGNASNSGGGVRNTYQSTSAPTAGDGQVGDIWIVYA